MEDTLRVDIKTALLVLASVLILILMEDTLRVRKIALSNNIFTVLILILMEDTLRVSTISMSRMSRRCLNPYSNGRYSESVTKEKLPGMVVES